MRVTGLVLQYAGGIAKRPLGVDHPLPVSGGSEKASKGIRIGQQLEFAEERQFSSLEGPL